jgi:hypothetical protein
LAEGDLHIDRFILDNRSNCIEEEELIDTAQLLYGAGQTLGCQGSRSHHHRAGWRRSVYDRLRDGMDFSRTVYTHEKGGNRRVINFADRTCRINTYGDSYTNC